MKHESKPVVLVKLAILSFGIGAALLFTPECKAQSDVSPDHFDGTDSWAVASRTVPASAQKLTVAKASLSVKSDRTARNSRVQLVAAREASKPVRFEVAAVEPKAAPRKPEKQ